MHLELLHIDRSNIKLHWLDPIDAKQGHNSSNDEDGKTQVHELWFCLDENDKSTSF